jgi:hypothetical protein
MNLVIKTLRYQIVYGFVETFSFRLRLYDDLSYTFFYLFFANIFDDAIRVLNTLFMFI